MKVKSYFKKSDIARYRTPIDKIVREIRTGLPREYYHTIYEYLNELNSNIKAQEVEVVVTIDGQDVKALQSTITINLEAINKYAHDGRLKELYVFIVSAFIVKGRGFLYRRHLLEALCITTGIRFKKMLEIEQFLLEEGLWKYDYRHDTIRPISKNKLPKRLQISNGKSIQIPYAKLIHYRSFTDHFICISHLKLQKTFEWALPKIKKNRNCPLLSQRVNFDGEPENKSKVGIAIRKLMQVLPFSYRRIQQALVGFTKRLYNEIDRLDLENFKKRYELSFFKKNPKYSFKYENGQMVVLYALGSRNAYNMRYCLKDRRVIY